MTDIQPDDVFNLARYIADGLQNRALANTDTKRLMFIVDQLISEWINFQGYDEPTAEDIGDARDHELRDDQ